MTLDPQVLNSIFNGLVLLLGGVGTLLAVRGRRAEVSGREHRATRRRLQVALAYIYRLGDELSQHGLPVPARPRGLDEDDDEPPPVPVRAGGPDARQ